MRATKQSAGTPDIPREARARSIWVQAQLRLKGKNLSDIARKLEVSRRAVSQGLYLANARIEQALADELGLAVQTLFPDRYDAEGRRLHATRGAQSITNAISPNVEGQEAA